MSYIPLINEISELDKKRINNYIHLYGVKSLDPLPAEEWLKQWEHSNQTLYKLLGNSLIKEIPFDAEKNRELIEEEFRHLREGIYSIFIDFCELFTEKYGIDDRAETTLRKIIHNEILIENSYKHSPYTTSKISLNNNKFFQIAEGAKPAKIINKMISLLEDKRDEFNDSDKFIFYEFKRAFERFKEKHSILLNEKKIKGTLCFSIHPLDFMTMSDNNSRWSSCMNWQETGCYRVGTVEMMNSNNVICVYLKSNSSNFNFSYKEEPKESEDYIWNNKRWRQLFYITKDIIVNGKSYPFAFDAETQQKILLNIRDLAKENLKWEYTYGPEHYKDMIHIHSKYRMDKNRNWIAWDKTTKHNILFDTKGMYNDFLNDVSFNYYCVRNKVKKNKIISVSGKARCLCCNGDALIENSDEDNRDYNERYTETGSLICQHCYDMIPVCADCGISSPNYRYIKIKQKDSDKFCYVCESCFKENYKKCPSCNEVFSLEAEHWRPTSETPWILLGEYDSEKMTRMHSPFSVKEALMYSDSNNIIKAPYCKSCTEKILSKENENVLWKKMKIFPFKYFWGKTGKNDYIINPSNRETIKVLIKEKTFPTLESIKGQDPVEIKILPKETKREYKEWRRMLNEPTF